MKAELKYDIASAIDSYESGIAFGIIHALSIIFHEERHKNIFKPCIIDDLIHNIINTTERAGPDCETWIEYSNNKVDPLIAEIRIALGKPATPPF